MTTPLARLTAWRSSRAERARIRAEEPYAHGRFLTHPAAGTTFAFWLLDDVDTIGLGAGVDKVIAAQAGMYPDLVGRRLVWFGWHESPDRAAFRAAQDAEYPGASGEYLDRMADAFVHSSLGAAWWRCVLAVRVADRAVAREHLPLCEPGAPLAPELSEFAQVQHEVRLLDDVIGGYGRRLTAGQIEDLHREFTRMGLPGAGAVTPSADPMQPNTHLSTLHAGDRVEQWVPVVRVDTAPTGFDSAAQPPWLAWFGRRPGRTYLVAQGTVVSPGELRKDMQLRLRENRSHERSSAKHGYDPTPEVEDGIARAVQVNRELRAQDRIDSYRVQAVVKIALPRDTHEAAAKAVTSVVKDADDQIHATVSHELGQYADWESMEPGRLFRLDGHVTQDSARVWAAGVPNSSGRAGATVGQLFGAVDGTRENLVMDWWEGPRAKSRRTDVEGSGVTLVVGGLGTGKSTVGVGAAAHCHEVGRRVIITDPSPHSGMARLVKAPGVDGREIPVTTQAPQGALMPHVLIPDPVQTDGTSDAEHAGALRAARAERVAFAVDMTRACAWELADDRDAMRAVSAACNEVGGAYGQHSSAILDALDREGDAGRRVGKLLRGKRDSLEGMLCFPEGDVDADRLTRSVSSAGVTVLTMPGIEIPDIGLDRHDWTVGMHQSVPILLGASRLAGLSLWADTDPKMQIDDELGVTLAGHSAMATLMRRSAYTSRKVDAAILWLMQTPTAMSRLGDDLIGSLVGQTLCGRVVGANAEVMARMMRLAPVDAARLPSLGTGDFTVRGFDGRVRHVHHDTGWWAPDVRRASLTTPSKEAPKMATLWGERAS